MPESSVAGTKTRPRGTRTLTQTPTQPWSWTSRIDTVRDRHRTATRKYGSCIGIYRLETSGRGRGCTGHRVCGRNHMQITGHKADYSRPCPLARRSIPSSSHRLLVKGDLVLGILGQVTEVTRQLREDHRPFATDITVPRSRRDRRRHLASTQTDALHHHTRV